jgi:hypothetical protein
LKGVLVVDAAASGALALLQVLGTGPLASLTNLPSTLLDATGIFLVGYAILLLALARASRVPSALIGLVVAGNVGWALGCMALLASAAIAPGPLGVAFVLAQAAAVLVFAALEYAGLRRSAPASGVDSMFAVSRTQ